MRFLVFAFLVFGERSDAAAHLTLFFVLLVFVDHCGVREVKVAGGLLQVKRLQLLLLIAHLLLRSRVFGQQGLVLLLEEVVHFEDSVQQLDFVLGYGGSDFAVGVYWLFMDVGLHFLTAGLLFIEVDVLVAEVAAAVFALTLRALFILLGGFTAELRFLAFVRTCVRLLG